MLIDNSRLTALFTKLKQIKEEVRTYALGGDDPCVSIDNLHRMIEQMYNLKISIIEVPVSGNHVVSMVRRYDDGTAEIVLRGSLPEPERRYAVAKELFHLALDEKEDWSSKGDETLEGLIELSRLELNGVTDHRPSHPVQCEHIAEFGAIELLYPHELREIADNEGSINIASIALKFKLPIRAIRTAHYEPFIKLCDQFRI